MSFPLFRHFFRHFTVFRYSPLTYSNTRVIFL